MRIIPLMHECMHTASAGLAGIRPAEGLQVLSAALQAAADAASSWPPATSAGPILWSILLKAPGRSRGLYDEFKVCLHG